MKNESAPHIALGSKENRKKKHISPLVCSVITYFELAVIVVLAIPVCLLLGAIAGVWIVTDKIVRAMDH